MKAKYSNSKMEQMRAVDSVRVSTMVVAQVELQQGMMKYISTRKHYSTTFLDAYAMMGGILFLLFIVATAVGNYFS